jgi:hypothetical protein
VTPSTASLNAAPRKANWIQVLGADLDVGADVEEEDLLAGKGKHGGKRRSLHPL